MDLFTVIFRTLLIVLYYTEKKLWKAKQSEACGKTQIFVKNRSAVNTSAQLLDFQHESRQKTPSKPGFVKLQDEDCQYCK